MEPPFTPPEPVIDQLKCSLCHNLLSTPPVTLISEDGNQYKCGRCSGIKTVINTRATMFEHLAKLMTFPCIYKDCSAKVTFPEVKDHEETCGQRSLACPKANCHETYKIKGMGLHFKEKHNESYHSNSFSIKNVYAYYNIDVLEKGGRTFVSMFDFDDINFGVSICAIDPTEMNYHYEIKLSSDNSKYSITITNQAIIAFNEREHCFKCVTGSCKSRFHVFKDNRKEVSKRMTTKINRESVKKMFGSGLISYSINILDGKEEKEPPKEEGKDVLIRKAKKIFLQMLECPHCKAYMSPPIHQCLTGHTVCKSCREKLEKCPSCEAKIEDTRNFTLEELSKKVELPQEDKKAAIKRTNSEEKDAETPTKVQKK